MITLLKDEEIILIQRKYWLPFVLEAIPLLLIIILPFILFIFIEAMPLPQDIKNIFLDYSGYYFFFAFNLIFIIWLFLGALWTNYYLDILIVTNKRIMDIEQTGLFARDEAEIRFEKIEDIRVEIVGFLPSLLKFGNIYIQSAAENREFILKDFQDPYKIKDIIATQKEKIFEESRKNS